MKFNTQYIPSDTLEIETLSSQGIGLSYQQNQLIEVPFSLPHEIVEVDVFHKSRNAQLGRILSIVKPHPQRQQPDCKHFGVCGGCTLQHCTSEFHDDFKLNKLIQALQLYQVAYYSIEPTIVVKPGKRRRIDFMGKKINNEIVLGFHQRLNKRRFNTQDCHVVHPDLKALFDPLRTLFQDILQDNELIHVFATRADNGVDLLLAGLKRHFDNQQILQLKKLAQDLGIVRLHYKVKTQSYEIYTRSEPYVEFAGFQIPISPYCFLQATKDSDQILAETITRYLPTSSVRVADLFCGRGTLTLPMIKAGYLVNGYECDAQSIQALKDLNLSSLNTFVRNLFDDPLIVDELTAFDAVVINPPRSGALSQINQIALAENLDLVIYVSCNPETFARDAKILQDGNYQLEHIIPLDQFIWTAHLEVIGIFRKT